MAITCFFFQPRLAGIKFVDRYKDPTTRVFKGAFRANEI